MLYVTDRVLKWGIASSFGTYPRVPRRIKRLIWRLNEAKCDMPNEPSQEPGLRQRQRDNIGMCCVRISGSIEDLLDARYQMW